MQLYHFYRQPANDETKSDFDTVPTFLSSTDPKKLLGQVERLEEQKVPIREILRLFGVK